MMVNDGYTVGVLHSIAKCGYFSILDTFFVKTVWSLPTFSTGCRYNNTSWMTLAYASCVLMPGFRADGSGSKGLTFCPDDYMKNSAQTWHIFYPFEKGNLTVNEGCISTKIRVADCWNSKET